MALVVFLRGVNVGGHRTFRPSVLAKELSKYDVVNVGAAGTFVVRRPGSLAGFRSALLKKLPFDTEVAICEGRDLLRLERDNPFLDQSPGSGVVRFVSVLVSGRGLREFAPVALPEEKEWLLRLVARNGRLVFGEYRRHMKTIGYLGRIDQLCGAAATTRNWNTIMQIVKILKRADVDLRGPRSSG